MTVAELKELLDTCKDDSMITLSFYKEREFHGIELTGGYKIYQGSLELEVE